MAKCTSDHVAVSLIDTDRDRTITSSEYRLTAIEVLRREALRLIYRRHAVTEASILSPSITSSDSIQDQADRFLQRAPIVYAGVIERLSPDDAQRIADAAASLRANVRDADTVDRISAGIQLFIANDERNERFRKALRACKAGR